MVNEVTKLLGIKYPIIQGAMNWLTDANFVAAVSKAGALGILGPNAGQTMVTDDPQVLASRIQEQVQAVKKITTAPFGITLNLHQDWTGIAAVDELTNLVIDEQVPVVLLTLTNCNDDFQTARQLVKTFHHHQTKVLVRTQHPTVADAQLAEQMEADLYIITSFDEGGNLPAITFGTFAGVVGIADQVEIPIACAGGISDARAVRAVCALGAQAVYVGTCLIPTWENPAAKKVKQLIVDSKTEDLTLYRTTPAYYRLLPTGLRDKLIENARIRNLEHALQINSTLMDNQNGLRRGMLQGDFDNGYVTVGTGISRINEIMTVKEVIRQLAKGFA
ncbi:nitronate monooxygenase [Lactobacillus alvi]|uniref:Probable nitronate monooxygenase n=1 Tax=Limosilactobacillus alvi TaxID=990412 RepID=A0ABS2EL30_9LACO|nr:nitronate monooxygenase family protein [Limosilactobacillus alvi]MBM6753214.1 nitronate monooxygenase [Limosilactobacillus alvi]